VSERGREREKASERASDKESMCVEGGGLCLYMWVCGCVCE